MQGPELTGQAVVNRVYSRPHVSLEMIGCRSHVCQVTRLLLPRPGSPRSYGLRLVAGAHENRPHAAPLERDPA